MSEAPVLLSKESLPYMSEGEIEVMNALFEVRFPERVLEWGCGGSTIYWPNRYDFIRVWVAVEHLEEWAVKLKGLCAPSVVVLHMDNHFYCDALLYNDPFDLILVDGMWRVACMKVASQILAPRGVVVLHDCVRESYDPTREYFEHSEVIREPFSRYGSGLEIFWNGDKQ